MNQKAGLLSTAELQYALKFQKELFPKGIASCGADALRLTLASLEFKGAFSRSYFVSAQSLPRVYRGYYIYFRSSD
jgi:hypothetical protein